MLTCRECGLPLRPSQEGAGGHRYANGTWLCNGCWVQAFDDTPTNDKDYFGPGCECCRMDLPHLEGMEGHLYRVAERSGWVEDAREDLLAEGTVEAADILYDRTEALTEELQTMERAFVSDDYTPEHLRTIALAQELVDDATDQAADVRGSYASEEEHRLAVQMITVVSQMKRRMAHMVSEVTLLSDEDEAEREIRRYWRVQGLEEAAAETAAALEIAEARKG